MHQFLALISIFFLMLSCSNTEEEKLAIEKKEQQEALVDIQKEEAVSEEKSMDGSIMYSKKINGLIYSTHLITGYDFYKKRSSVISKKDSLDLIQETVVVLEIESTNPKNGIWENENLQMELVDAKNYLVGGITNDMSIQVNQKEIKALGVNFENQHGSPNKIRTYFFFGVLNNKKIKDIRFFDRLFNAGMIRYSIN